jgi:hypothetical protein
MRMSKLAVCILSLLILVLLATSCGGTKNSTVPATTTPEVTATIATTTPPPKISLTTYENTAHGFSFGHPAEWTENITGAEKSFTFKFSEINDLLFSLVGVDYGTGDVALSDFVSKNLAYMEVRPQYKLISQSDIVINGSTPAQELVVKMENVSGKLYQYKIILFVRGNQSFTVAVGVNPASYEEQTTLVDAIVKSFTLLPTYTYIPPALSPGGTYTNTEYGFSLVYPEGWAIVSPTPKGVIARFLFDKSAPVINIAIYSVEQGTTLDAFLVQAKESLNKIWDSHEIIAERNMTLKDGTPAYEAIISGTSQGTLLKCKYLVVMNGTQVFTIWGLDVPPQYELYKAAIDEVIYSFHIN